MTTNSSDLPRRRVLSLLGTGGTAAIAGCDEHVTQSPEGTPTGTATAETPTDSSGPPAGERLVGAHYYPWYESHGGHQHWTERTIAEPVLGEYAADAPAVIDQHLEWCLDHEIWWLSMSWWGEGSGTDRAINDAIVHADRFEDMAFSILYETVGRLKDHDYDLDDAAARDRLRSDLCYLEETYFHRDNYLRFDDRPVVFFYAAQTFRGDVEAGFADVVGQLDTAPYVLADIPFGRPPGMAPVTRVADGITTYNPYAARPDIAEVFHEMYNHGNAIMHLGADVADVDFVPVVLPGYNDTAIPAERRADNPVLPASPERYKRVCAQVSPHLDASKAVLITSFNEWYEDTQIEPSETHGTAYLELTAESLATGPSAGFDPAGVMIRLAFNTTIVPADIDPDSRDTRELAFMASGLRLLEGDKLIRSYDIGTADEPLFLQGAYGRASHDGRTWRWLGGPDAETTLFVEGDVGSTDRLVVNGQPMRSNQITADVCFDGTKVGHIEFRERVGRFDEYEVSV